MKMAHLKTSVPEFRNRLDGVVTFGKLSKEVMMKIVGKFLVELKNMVADKNITIKLDDEALDLLVDKGFDLAKWVQDPCNV